MTEQRHTKGLHRGYCDDLRVDWENGGGFSTITLLNDSERPVAVLLGDYVPGECDADMDYAADLFSAAPAILNALKALLAVAEMTTFSDQFPAECEQANLAIEMVDGQ